MPQASVCLFVAAWCCAVFAWFRSVAFLVKAARRTKPGRLWWLRLNMLGPIFDPAAWPSDALTYWRKHLLWAGIFVGCAASGLFIGYLGAWPTEHR
jgi:hypothetical protein